MLTYTARAILAQINAGPSIPESPKHGLIVNRRKNRIVGYNLGSFVRPEICQMTVRKTRGSGIVEAVETVESFLNRGNTITKLAPCTKHQKTQTIKSRPTRFAVSRG